ncbi:MAG: cob(I)yrinic acid a,c-diamide adenosyltransferase [Paludibacteraceae bacterium]|nr:cob(I)yrinic acid a,c-diamide adenosyltransferase [Paludibacteraceae bacterium]
MKVYTKTGDRGQTSLATMERVSKDDIRLQAYGTADELNSFVGLLRAKWPEQMKDTDQRQEWIQNKLFNLGAELAGAEGDWIVADDVDMLEKWIDEMQETITPLHGFILPGGSEAVALTHVCRTVTRRLERWMVSLGPAVKPISLQFVNRLSDFWFVLGEKVAENEKISLFLWKK